jgi:hypothetical protein
VLSKITERGVLLVIDPSGQKSDKNAITVQYPVFEVQYKNKPYLKFSNAGGLMASRTCRDPGQSGFDAGCRQQATKKQ